MVRRILITGAGGFLGSRLFEYFDGKDGYEAIGVTHRELDIADSLAVKAFIKAIRPDVVLHCAAISNTGTCQKEPGLSERVNVLGTANLARACKENGSRMLFMSSDQIYMSSASMEPNCEGEKSRPLGVYGRDKKRAEELMLHALKDSVALRLTWMYDYPTNERIQSSNLLAMVLRALKEEMPLMLSVHDYRGITYVWEVVRNMEKALDLPPGVYNFGSENRYSSYDTGRMFADALSGGRTPEGRILPDTERFAACPRNLTINTDKLKTYGIGFYSTAEGIKRCMKDYGIEAGNEYGNKSGINSFRGRRSAQN